MGFVLQVFELNHDSLRASLAPDGGGAVQQEIAARLAGDTSAGPLLSPAAESQVVDVVQGRGRHLGDVIGSGIDVFMGFWNFLSRQVGVPDLAEALLWGRIAGIPCSGDPGWGGLRSEQVAEVKAKLAAFDRSSIDAASAYDSEVGLYGEFILDWLGDLERALADAHDDVVTLLL